MSHNWDVCEIAATVADTLGRDRDGKCTLACRLIIAACGYALSRDALHCDDVPIVQMFLCKGNVNNCKGEQRFGHWWTEFVTSKGDTIYMDVTAQQFFPRLPSVYKGNPYEAPLCAKVTGFEIGRVDSKCGCFEQPKNKFRDKSNVLGVYQKIDKSLNKSLVGSFLERDLSTLYNKLNMK